MRGARPERALEAHVDALRIAPSGATVVVACSGGPDSVALASLLARMRERSAWRLVLAHVNHGIRESAWQDECIVLSVAARIGAEVRIAALAGEARDESTLRAQRYAQLATIARDSGAAVVATAHTAQDQTETVLLALFRGTGPDGLSGMPIRRRLEDGIELVRPLLRIGRESLRAELRASALPYALDPLNADPRYRRTLVRDALAGLRGEFPRLDEAVARCAAILADERASNDRGAARLRLRASLAATAGLRDVPFERIEAALAAEAGGKRGRVYVKDGVDFIMTGDAGAEPTVGRRHD